MNSLKSFLAIVVIAVTVSCTRNSEREKEYPDMSFIRNIGYDYAMDYREMLVNSSEMEREDFLLGINAREAQLEREVGAEYARAFRQAFADSAFVK